MASKQKLEYSIGIENKTVHPSTACLGCCCCSRRFLVVVRPFFLFFCQEAGIGPGVQAGHFLIYFSGVEGSALDQTIKEKPWSKNLQNLQTFLGLDTS